MRESPQQLKPAFLAPLSSQIFMLISRLLLGGIFIFSASVKLISQTDFVHTVVNYNILPYCMAGLYGSMLPWIELLIGCFLILGLYSRFAASTSLALIFSFITANIYAMSQNAVACSPCGCLGKALPLNHAGALILDSVMVLLTIPLILSKSRLLEFNHLLGDWSSKLKKAPVIAHGGVIRLVSVVIVTFMLTLTPSVSLADASSQSKIMSPATIPGMETGSQMVDEVVNNSRPEFLFFYTDWCHYCQQEKPIIDELEREYGDRINFVRILGEDNPQAMETYNVKSYPTMFLMSGEVQEGERKYQRFDGFTDKDSLKQSFDYLLQYGVLSSEPKSLNEVNTKQGEGSGGQSLTYSCGENPTCSSGKLDVDSTGEIAIREKIDKALENGRAAFLFLYAEWCHFCQQEKPVIDELEKKYTEDIAFIRVNNKDNPQVLEEFGVTSFPTMFLIIDENDQGYVSRRFSGFTNRETLEKSFDYYLTTGSLPDSTDIFVPESANLKKEELKVFGNQDLSLAEFQVELSSDADFKEMHDQAKKMGYVYPSKINRVTYSNNSTSTIAMMTSSDNTSVFLSRYSSGGSSHSTLLKSDGKDIIVFDKDGGTRIGADGSVSTWNTHHSCTWTDRIACNKGCFTYRGLEPGRLLSLSATILNCGVCAACAGVCATTIVACAASIPTGGELCPLVGACGTCILESQSASPGPTPGCVDCITDGWTLLVDYIDIINDCFTECAADPTKYPYSSRRCCQSADGINCPNPSPSWLVCGQYNIIRRTCTDCEITNTIEQSCSPGYCQTVNGQPQCVTCLSDADCNVWNPCSTGRCVNNACQYTPINCDDHNGCTNDWCDPLVGCMYVPRAGCDHPDDSNDMATPEPLQDASGDAGIKNHVAVLRQGDGDAFQGLLNTLDVPSTLVDINFTPDLVLEHPVLVVPSGGLYGLDSSASFKSRLAQYVERGGTLIAFSQQHGYEYRALPGGEVDGYGWLEDESCQLGSAGISAYHPILSGQDSVTLNVNIDGFFTHYSENATILLTRTKNGMPAMLMYEYGEGRVIATTAFTDWAFKARRETQHERNLVRDMIAWAEDSQEIPGVAPTDQVDIPVDVFNVHLPLSEVDYPQYVPGDEVNITIDIPNGSDNTSDRVVFSLYDPDYAMEATEVLVSIPPGATEPVNFTYTTNISSKTGVYLVLYSLYTGETILGAGLGSGFGLGVDVSDLTSYSVNFSLNDPHKNVVHQETASLTALPGQTVAQHFNYENPSDLGIWSLEYDILDYNDVIIESGVKQFAVSKYSENPEGWSYQGSEMTFALTSDNERYVIGSNAIFTLHAWNHGDTERAIRYILRRFQLSDIEDTITVPAQGSANSTYSMPAFNGRVLAYFYDATTDAFLGYAEKGMWALDPSVGMRVSTDKRQYGTGEDVFLTLNLENVQKLPHNASTTVRILNTENVSIFEQGFNVTLPPASSEERTFEFTLSGTAEYGIYAVQAEAYVAGRKAGSASAYFVVRESTINLRFDRSDRAYRVREDMNLSLEVSNISVNPGSLTVDISIPDLSFIDSADFTLEPGQTGTKDYNLTIPENTPAGKHDIVITIQQGDETRHYHFSIPESQLALALDVTVYNAGDEVAIDLTDTGGVDTTCNCSTKLFDSRWSLIHESNTQESLMAGETKALSFTIPGQVASGDYYLLVQCQDQSTGRIVLLVKPLIVTDLAASLTSVTDKKVYLSDDDIAIQTEIASSGGEISVGTLHIEVNPAFTPPGDGVTEDWEARYDNPADDTYSAGVYPYDDAFAVAVDGAGNVYVTGESQSSCCGTEFNDFATVKYDPDGNQVWTEAARYNGSYNTGRDVARYIGVDSAGNVYVTGDSVEAGGIDHITTIKYDADGNQLWLRGLPGFRLYYAMAVDNQGNVYVTARTGVTYGMDYNYGGDFTTVKYDTEGNEVWVAVYDSGYPDWPKAIVFDSQGNAYVSGEVGHWNGKTFVGDDYVTVKYDSADGELLWDTTYDGGTSQGNFAAATVYDIGLDNSGNIYVTGQSFACTPVLSMAATVKYDADGNELWVACDDTLRQGWALAITPWDDVYVISKRALALYDSDTGDRLWVEELDDEYLYPNAITVDGSGNAYVAGNGGIDGNMYSIAKYDPSGNPLWVGYSDPVETTGYINLRGVALDAEDDIIVTGVRYDYEGQDGGSYYTVKFNQVPTGTVWEQTIPVDVPASGTVPFSSGINIPGELHGITGKLKLLATLSSGSGQVIAQSQPYSFFITDADISLTMETDKETYKPNETITISGEVQNNTAAADDLTLKITGDGEEIFSESFSLAPGEVHSFTTTTTSESSFKLEGRADGVKTRDWVNIVAPDVEVDILAPDVVELADFDVSILVQNTAQIDADINVTLAPPQTWHVLIPAGESRLLESMMSITENTTLNVVVSGDVEKAVQKQITMGESAIIHVSPAEIYLEGSVEIPITVENTGLLDTEFEATFTIDSQNISRAFFVPRGQSITDTLPFDLIQGSHTLQYSSPFEDASVDINVGVPEFELTLPDNLNLSVGEEVTWTFGVKNIGGAEGEAQLHLIVPDYEENKFTWVCPGQEEQISFTFVVSDDLQEKEYTARYEFNGVRHEFSFFVQGAKFGVEASLDKSLYEEGETAIFTLNVVNLGYVFLNHYYARVNLNDYEEVQPFELMGEGWQQLQFNVPVSFNGGKLFYGIYMDSGRALYLNSLYVQEQQEVISLYTDKQVYQIGEMVTVYVEAAQSGTLQITAPGYIDEVLVTGNTVLNFTVPALRSGTYSIDYTLDGFLASYPFDVEGYSARITEFNLGSQLCTPGESMAIRTKVDINTNIDGVFRLQLYDSRFNLLDEFDIPVTFIQGENEITVERAFSCYAGGMYALFYGVYIELPGPSLTPLASGVEYFDSIFPESNVTGPSVAYEGSPVLFDASGSVNPNGNALQYRWDYDGDGIWDTPWSSEPSLTYTWYDDYIGSVGVEVSNGEFTDADTVGIIVENVPPIVNSGSDATINKGDIFARDGFFNDPGSDNWTATVDYGDGSGAQPLTLNPDKTFFLSRLYPESGNFTVTVEITDDDGGVGIDALKLTVAAANLPPVAENQVVTTETGTPINITLTAFDPDGDDLTFNVVTPPGHGILSGTAPDLTYTPDTDFAGSDNFTFKANDGIDDSNAAVVSIEVSHVNEPPAANADGPYMADEGNVIDFDGAGSYDPDGTIVDYAWDFGDGFTITGSNPQHVYTDDGIYDVILTVTDNEGVTGSATTNATIGDLGPTAEFTWSPEPQDEGSAVAFTDTSTSSPDVIVSWAWDLAGLDTSADRNPSFSFMDNGVYTVTLTVTDDDGSTDVISHDISILGLGPTASLTGDSVLAVGQTGNYDASGSTSYPDVIVSFEWDWNYDGSSFNPSGDSGATQSHAWDTTGTYAVAMRVTDDDGSTAIATLSVIVSAVNRPPELDLIGDKTVNEGEPLEFTVTAGDPDGDELEFTASGLPSGASFNTTTHVFSWTPGFDQSGSYPNVHFEVSDGLLSDSENITITVINVNRIPVANDQTVITQAGTPVAVTLTATDADNDDLTFDVVTPPANGTLSGVPPDLIYTPDVGFSGSDNFTYKANDRIEDSNVAIVSITIIAAEEYTIIATAGTGGSILPSGSIPVNQGNDQAFVITPDTGYRIADILVDGLSVGVVSNYTFNNVTENHAIEAIFTATETSQFEEFFIKHLLINWDKTFGYSSGKDKCREECRKKYNEYLDYKAKFGKGDRKTERKYNEYLKFLVNYNDCNHISSEEVQRVLDKYQNYLDFLKKFGENDKKTQAKYNEYLKYVDKCGDGCKPPLPISNLHVYGRLKVPEGMSVADFEKLAVVTLTFSDGSLSDSIVFSSGPGRPGTLWQGKDNEKLDDVGLDVEKMGLWWAPSGRRWDGWAGFYISGEFIMPEEVDDSTEPPEITIGIDLTTETGLTVKGEATVLCKVTGKGSVWQYSAKAGWPRFPFDLP